MRSLGRPRRWVALTNEAAPGWRVPWQNRAMLLCFSLHHVFFVWGFAGAIGAAAVGATAAIIGSCSFAAFAVLRCVTCGVTVEADAVVVRNRWRTYRLPRDGATTRPGALFLFPPGPTLLVLEAGGKRVKLHATVSPSRDLRQDAIAFLGRHRVAGERLKEYADASFG